LVMRVARSVLAPVPSKVHDSSCGSGHTVCSLLSEKRLVPYAGPTRPWVLLWQGSGKVLTHLPDLG
jgi:hypothetical protein